MNKLKQLAHLFFLLLVLSACASKKQVQVDKSAESKAIREKYTRITGQGIPREHLPLYQYVEEWWGVPHKIGGLDSSGIDCSGFVYRLFREVYGKEVARSTDGLLKTVAVCDTVDLVTGDLVFIVFQGRKKPSHVGVYLQNGRFAHASTSKGVRVDFMRDVYYSKQQFIGGKLP